MPNIPIICMVFQALMNLLDGVATYYSNRDTYNDAVYIISSMNC